MILKKLTEENGESLNPYNPWTEDKTEKEVQNLQVESLDDLFDEEPKNPEEKKEKVTITNSKETEKIESLDDMFGDIEVPNSDENSINQIEEEEDSYDLQKELEAKFDELFGPIDD